MPQCQLPFFASHGLHWLNRLLISLTLFAFGAVQAADSVTLQDLQNHYLKGEYETCIDKAKEHLEQHQHSQYWRVILIKAHLAVGEVDEAMQVLEEAMDRFSRSVALRWIRYELAQLEGDFETAAAELKEIDDYAGPRLRYLQDPEHLVLLGRAALAMGAEPKLVLDNFFSRAQQSDPNYAEAWLAAGQLALDKHDFDLAARTFETGLAEVPDHPDLLHGRAQAYASSDRMVMLESLINALNVNTNHVPSHLLLADHLIDAEDYDAADQQLDLVLKINPVAPEAWAYRAVLAHLRNQPDLEEQSRSKALEVWKGNANVDHLIGKKLSLKYRFKEGAQYQRLALLMNTNLLGAKVQLSQDLLRLGQDTEGWQLADEVNQSDGYDITAFNLVTLRDQYQRFASLTNEHFIVRMEAGEADVFGQRVLDLLDRARATLAAKYGVELTNRTLVEIFADSRDFAVRTFGMPGNPGYLGVCFGDVITANSPTSPAGSAASWESVLWHEFCHVITLNMTRNKMPRWLSEGISVYEELAEDASWGQKMDPDYRALILSGKMKPVSNLSAAFLTAESNIDLQFAYYQSALVVDFIVQTYGFDSLKNILNALGKGVKINDAIAEFTEAIDDVDENFREFAEELAKETGKGFEWIKPEIPERGVVRMSDMLANNPVNYWVLTGAIEEYIAEGEWEKAESLLDDMFAKAENGFDTPLPHILRAKLNREKDDTDGEFSQLQQAAMIDGNQVEIFQRLLDISHERKNWDDVRAFALRVLSINPASKSAYRSLAEAAEQLEQPEVAIAAYETLLKLDPLNPASVHFAAAKLQLADDPDAAKRHVLFALEVAPRYRAAHQLLLKVNQQLAMLNQEDEPEPAPEEAGDQSEVTETPENETTPESSDEEPEAPTPEV